MSESTTDLPISAATPAVELVGEGLLPQLVHHLRQNRTALREEWARRITEAELLTAMSPEEIFSEATTVYDSYVEVLETGSVEALQDYARDLSERIIPRGVETDEVVGIVLLLRDVLARSLFEKYQTDFDLLNRVLDAYEPAANRIANTVAVGFVQERERIIRQQQEAIQDERRRRPSGRHRRGRTTSRLRSHPHRRTERMTRAIATFSCQYPF